MIFKSNLFFWLLQCSLLRLGNADDSHHVAQHVRGVPGKDYPHYQTIPQTSFRCSEQPHIPGFYADPETGCQMFHHCYEHRHESFLCPPGTIFNQAILSCDYWYSADCSTVTVHYEAKSPKRSISFEPEIEFVPTKSPSVSVFDKMASLYEVKGPATINSKYESNGYTFEGNNYFRNGDSLSKNTRMIESQKYTDGYLKVSNHHDRREGVIVEYPDGEPSYFHDNENGLRMFEDSFEDSVESSGESEDSDDHAFTEDDLLLSQNDQQGNADFEKQYFTYNEDNHSEYDEEHSGNVRNEEEVIDSYTEFSDGQASYSNDLESGDKFSRRQSGDIENRNDRRNKRRKPIFTIIEPTAEVEHFTSTESYEDKIKINSNDIVDFPSYTSKESEAESNTLSTSTPSRTKRRKPILIDIEDSLQYNVDNGQNVAGDKRTSISSKINDESKLPEFSIDAEEISVKLLPRKLGRKRKPVYTNLLDSLEQYNVGSERNIDLSSLNLASSASNIYDTSTLSTMEDIERYEDVSMNFDQIYPKRKKNIIRIIDYDNDHNVYTENEESTDATTYASKFEDEITTQSFSKKFNDFNKFPEPSYHAVEKVHEIEDDSLELVTEQYDDPYNFISPDTHYEISDGPEVTFKVNEYEDESAVEDKAISVNPESLEDSEVDTHNEMHDFSYVTTDFSISDISTEMPTELQYTEETTSRFYFIPNSIVQPLDNLGTSESIHYLVPATMDEKHDFRDSLAMSDFEFNPSYHTSTKSISYELLDDSMVSDEVIEHAHKEDGDFQNTIKLPDETYESHTEIKYPQNSEFEGSSEENILNYEDETLNANIPENITNAEYAQSSEVDELDPLLDKDFQEYLSNENSNIQDNLNVDLAKNIHTEPAVSVLEDSSTKHSLGKQYNSFDPIFDVNTMVEAQDSIQDEGESIHQTVPTEIESDHYQHQSDDPIKTDILERIEQESVENEGAEEFYETSDIEASSSDLKDSRTNNLNDFVSHPAMPSDFTSFETQNIPNYPQENSYNTKAVLKSKSTVGDASKSNIGNTVSSSEANTLNKEHSILERNIPGSIKTDTKEESVRRPRTFMSPYRMDFNHHAFDSQNFASLPYSMLKLKQSDMEKFLPYSMYRHGSEGMAYSTRTGNLLESPKISKLISMGKKLLTAKKAKFRILSKYVNSYQTDQ